MSKGEYIVGVDFNPSGNKDVDNIKAKSADLIDTILEMRDERMKDVGKGFDEIAGLEAQYAKNTLQREIFDLCELSVRQVEQAAMLAVKAATKRPPDLEE